MKPVMKRLLLALPLVLFSALASCAAGSSPYRSPDSERVRTISAGEEVTLADHLSPTGVTVVEFGAMW